jgi:Uma2 family endonuclease
MSTQLLDKPEIDSSLESGYEPWVIVLPGDDLLTDDWFAEVASMNRDFRIERNAKGDLEFMAPTGGKTGDRNSELNMQLRLWAKKNGTGRSFDSSTGFRLPNSAIRAPDASWVRNSKLDSLTNKQLEGYLPLAPDFAIELRSPTDRLAVTRAKMIEYMDNGTELGWLIDPISRTVAVYRSEGLVEEFTDLESISDEIMLPGFSLNLTEIW